MKVFGDRAFVAQQDGIREYHQPSAGVPWNEVAHIAAPSQTFAVEGGSLLVGVPSEDGFIGAVHL